MSYADPLGLLKWTGTFRLRGAGYGELGGVYGTFELVSECDIDGNQGFARVRGLAPTIGVGAPLSETRGTVTFEDGSIRANPLGLGGRFRVDSIGVQIGPIGISRTNIYLGRGVSTKVDDQGIDVGIQIGIRGLAEVETFEVRRCNYCK